jgi:hypothetical protein
VVAQSAAANAHNRIRQWRHLLFTLPVSPSAMSPSPSSR